MLHMMQSKVFYNWYRLVHFSLDTLPHMHLIWNTVVK